MRLQRSPSSEGSRSQTAPTAPASGDTVRRRPSPCAGAASTVAASPAMIARRIYLETRAPCGSFNPPCWRHDAVFEAAETPCARCTSWRSCLGRWPEAPQELAVHLGYEQRAAADQGRAADRPRRRHVAERHDLPHHPERDLEIVGAGRAAGALDREPPRQEHLARLGARPAP